MSESGNDKSLKQLNFVPEYGSKGYEMANNAYSTAKTYVPGPLKERLTNMEAVTAPIVNKAADKGTELLKAVDAKVRMRIRDMVWL